jgi:aryl-alcohol dehydrogenase
MTTAIMHLISGRVVRGIVEGDADPPSFIPFLVERFREGKFPIDRLTDFYPFEQINSAVAAGVSGRTIKPVIEF